MKSSAPGAGVAGPRRRASAAALRDDLRERRPPRAQATPLKPTEARADEAGGAEVHDESCGYSYDPYYGDSYDPYGHGGSAYYGDGDGSAYYGYGDGSAYSSGARPSKKQEARRVRLSDALAKEEQMRRASRASHVLHNKREENDRADDATRRRRRRHGEGDRRSSGSSHSSTRPAHTPGSRLAERRSTTTPLTAAQVAAHAPDFGTRLSVAATLAATRERGEGTAEERLADAEEEVAVLKQELVREREHGFREMRELRVGWEDAEVRATALERQVVYLRCSEEVLSAELSYSEELVSWWKQEHAKLKAAALQVDMELTGYRNRVSTLSDELDRTRTAQREEQTALGMQEQGRTYLRKRLSEAEAALTEERARSMVKAEELEALRKAELEAHAHRCGEVSARLGIFEEKMHRMRLDVSEWAACDETFKTLRGLLAAEMQVSSDFNAAHIRTLEEERRAEAARFEELEGELLSRLEDAVAQRADFIEEMREIGDTVYKRKMQELSADMSKLRSQLDTAEALAVAKEEWAAAQLARLKEAFRADVHVMAQRLDELRTENIRQTLHLRSHGRFVARQNLKFKAALGDHAIDAALRRRRLVAWLGWRGVVARAKVERQGTELLRFERAEKGGMIDYLQEKLAESRKKFEARVAALQSSHAVELGSAQHQAVEATEMLERVKTFSAAKLCELADELEELRQRQRQRPPPMPADSGPTLAVVPTSVAPALVPSADPPLFAAPPPPHPSPPPPPHPPPLAPPPLAALTPPEATPPPTTLPAPALVPPDVADAAGDAGGAAGAHGWRKARTAMQLDVKAAQLGVMERRLQEAGERIRQLERKLRHTESSKEELRAAKLAQVKFEALRAGQSKLDLRSTGGGGHDSSAPAPAMPAPSATSSEAGRAGQYEYEDLTEYYDEASEHTSATKPHAKRSSSRPSSRAAGSRASSRAGGSRSSHGSRRGSRRGSSHAGGRMGSVPEASAPDVSSREKLSAFRSAIGAAPAPAPLAQVLEPSDDAASMYEYASEYQYESYETGSAVQKHP